MPTDKSKPTRSQERASSKESLRPGKRSKEKSRGKPASVQAPSHALSPSPSTGATTSRTSQTRPKWETTGSGLSQSQGSSRKCYLLLGIWAVVLTSVVAFSAAGQDVLPSRAKLSSKGKKVSTVFDTAFADAEESGPWRVELQGELDEAMPSCFRNKQTNQITRPHLLESAAKILSQGQRPLRILHIGDSHVAGEDFPKALKKNLSSHLGEARSSDEGSGVWFRFIGSNGATTNRFLSESYLNRFSAQEPDLIILSCGTNEAHGMGYREDAHEKDLDKFLTALQKACPGATILLTTPPGDYLSSRAGKRNKSRRSWRENPMSSRCAAFLESYGKRHNLPVWDLFTICGGKEAAQRNWVSAGLMQKDRIHFLPAGYALHGRLLGNAICSALSKEEP